MPDRRTRLQSLRTRTRERQLRGPPAFHRDETGGATVQNIFRAVLCLGLLGLAIDIRMC